VFSLISCQGDSNLIYATIKHAERTVHGKDGSVVKKREAIDRPYRIAVSKSEVYIAYPLKMRVSIATCIYIRVHVLV